MSWRPRSGRGRDLFLAQSTQTYTADFRAEFEADTTNLLRRRFLWFSGSMASLSIASLVFVVIAMFLPRVVPSFTPARPPGSPAPAAHDGSVGTWYLVSLSAVYILLYAGSFVLVLTRGYVTHLVRLSMLVVGIDGLINIAVRALKMDFAPGLTGFAISHAMAACFLPWTARQAIIPALVVLGTSAFLKLSGIERSSDDLGWRLFGVAISPLSAMPGTIISWLRHSQRMSQHKLKFFQSRYADVRRELVDARRIHEALFPAPRAEEPLSFDYQYEPMRQIGGDYLYASWSEGAEGGPKRLSVVLIDVTGHGIPAALTVNRVHGELERVFGENPDVPPGEVLRLLNRYVHLTLATHSVYVTALCVRVDPTQQRLEYASGGHPPAFIRAVDGTVHELESTTYVLGACEPEAFAPDARALKFGPGDSVIAYTDGAIEARDRQGKMLGIRGVQRLIASTPPDASIGWASALRRAVETHRFGPPADDTLVVEIKFALPLGAASLKRSRTEAHDRHPHAGAKRQ